LFDYIVSWDYLGLTGETSPQSMTQFVNNSYVSPYQVAVISGLPDYLNSASNVLWTVNRKLCGTRPSGQIVTSSRVYRALNNSASLPATWSGYVSPIVSGCIKTCPTIFSTYISSNSFVRTTNLAFPYVHIMIGDEIRNTSC